MVENSDWRICRGVALAIGWLSIFVNCGLIYIIFAYPGQFGRNLHETLIPILPVISMLACYCWFFGIGKIKFAFMLAALVFWGINLCIIFICVYSSTLEYKNDKQKSSLVSIYFFVPTVYFLVSYYVSVVCFTIMKKSVPRKSVPKGDKRTMV